MNVSLAALSQRAYQLAAQGRHGDGELRLVEAEIDRLAAKLWSLTEEELAAVHTALAGCGKTRVCNSSET